MFNKQLVRDLYGQYYKIHTSREKPAPDALEPKQFHSTSQAYRFINDLVATTSYWKSLCHSESLAPDHNSSENDVKNKLAELFCKGKLKAYKVETLSASDSQQEKRTLIGKNKDKYTFTHASTLLITYPKEVLSFTDKKEAADLLSTLSPDDISLQGLVDELELPKTELDGELTNLVADGLASGEIVVLLEKYFIPTSPGEDSEDDVHDDKDASGGPATKECTFDTMLVKCSHHPKDRSYQLDVVNSKENLNDSDKALQVIAKKGDPDEISIEYSGSCVNGSKTCPSIKVSSDTLNGVFTDNPYKFEALPLDNEREPGNFLDFLQYYLVPDLSSLDYQVYTIEKSGCNGNSGYIAKVHAFPTFKWEGSVSFGYVMKDGSNKKNSKNVNERGNWELDCKLDGEVGTKKYEFIDNNKNKIKEYFPGLEDKLSNFIEDIDEMGEKTTNLGTNVSSLVGLESDSDDGLLKFDVSWPKISLFGAIELIEAKNDFDVDVGGEIGFNLSPLINASVRTDILDWIILASGPQGKFLLKVKNKIKKKADVAVDIILNGKIDAMLKWKKSAHDKWLSTEGANEGAATLGLFLGLEARAKATVDMFFVKVTVGLEVHAKGNTEKGAGEGIGVIFGLHATTNKDYPAFGGRFRFTGIAIYLSYYAQVARDELSSEESSADNLTRSRSNPEDDEDDTDSISGKEQEMRKIQDVMKPWDFPEKPDSGSGIRLQDAGF